MKRKPQARTEPPRTDPAKPAPPGPESPRAGTGIPQEILEDARRTLAIDRSKVTVKCVVCGAETAPGSAEQLCWVCRRLKISAWRDVEQQMPAQE